MAVPHIMECFRMEGPDNLGPLSSATTAMDSRFVDAISELWNNVSTHPTLAVDWPERHYHNPFPYRRFICAALHTTLAHWWPPKLMAMARERDMTLVCYRVPAEKVKMGRSGYQVFFDPTDALDREMVS